MKITPSDSGSGFVVDENAAGSGDGIVVRYHYKAPASGVITFDFLPLAVNATWHHYAFSNEVAAAVPGVDMLFLGPGDMSLRLGCTAAVGDPRMLEVQKQLAAAAKKHGKAWGRPVGSAADAKVIIDLGAQLVAFGGEFSALHQHFSQCSAQFDELLGEKSGQPAIPAGKTY